MKQAKNEHLVTFVDEVGFNLVKTRCRGRNLIGKRATVDVPDQRGANITMCTAISVDGLQLHKAALAHTIPPALLPFFNGLYKRLAAAREQDRQNSFHHSRQVTGWVTARGVASFSKVRGMDVICLLTIETMDTMTEVYNMYNIQDIKSIPFK